MQDQLGKGLISEEDAKNSPQKNLITARSASTRSPRPMYRRFRTRPGDIYLLCSDGLSDLVNPEALLTHLSTERPPGDYTKRLIDAANANGGRDNISVIIVRVGDPPIADLWWQKFLKKPADKK